MIHGTKDNAVMLSATLLEGDTDQYPQLLIYTTGDALSATVNLSHVVSGLYRGTWTPGTNGFYHGIGIVYTDAGHTVESTLYGRSGVLIKIDEVETNIDDIETDTGTTLPATLTTIEGKIDTIDAIVDTITADVKRVLGLSHENVYIDNTVYDTYGNLTSARLRTYSVAASVGTGSDVLETYTITATGTDVGRFTYWKQVV